MSYSKSKEIDPKLLKEMHNAKDSRSLASIFATSAVMDAVMDKIVTHPHAAPVITVYDKNKGGTAVKLHDDIEGITVLHNTNA